MSDSIRSVSINSLDDRNRARTIDDFLDEPVTSVSNNKDTDKHNDDHSMTSSLAFHTLTSLKEGILNAAASRHCKILLFGQFISFVMASLWATQSTLHLQCNLSAPAFSNIWVYVILSLNVIPLYRQGRRIKEDHSLPDPPYWILRGTLPLHMSHWRYLGLAIIGFEANYIMMSSLRYTTLTSAALFDALSIPSAMVLSSAVLRRKYRFAHLLGAAICLLGMTINIITDFMSNFVVNHADAATTIIKATGEGEIRDDGSDEYPHKILGDLMAICGGILYGINDVLVEITVKKNGRVTEYLAVLSLWGIVITTIQAAILEREAITAFFYDGPCVVRTSILLLAAYITCQTIRKTCLAYFVLISEAALLNLSLLTSDVYTTFFSVLEQNILPRPFFFVGLAMVISGIFIYEMAPSPAAEYDDRTPNDVRIRNIKINQLNLAAVEFADGSQEMRERRQRSV